MLLAPMDPRDNPNLNGSGVTWSVFENKKCQCHRDELVLYYFPVVERVAAKLWRKTPWQVELDDLISIGTFGLIQAVAGFNPCQGTPFEPYAAAKVRSVILDEARTRDWAPRSLRRRQKDIDRTIEDLSTHLRREPTQAELAEELDFFTPDIGWTPDLVRQTLLATEASYPVSLDVPVDEDGTTRYDQLPRFDQVPDPHPEPDSSWDRNETCVRVAEHIRSLPIQDMFVLALNFSEELPMSQVALIAGIPETRAIQIQTKVVMEIRELLLHLVKEGEEE